MEVKNAFLNGDLQKEGVREASPRDMNMPFIKFAASVGHYTA